MKVKDLKKEDLLYAIDKDDCFTILEIIRIFYEYMYGLEWCGILVLNRLSSVSTRLVLCADSVCEEVIIPLVGEYHFVSCSEQAIIDKLNELCSK